MFVCDAHARRSVRNARALGHLRARAGAARRTPRACLGVRAARGERAMGPRAHARDVYMVLLVSLP